MRFIVADGCFLICATTARRERAEVRKHLIFHTCGLHFEVYHLLNWLFAFHNLSVIVQFTFYINWKGMPELAISTLMESRWWMDDWGGGYFSRISFEQARWLKGWEGRESRLHKVTHPAVYYYHDFILLARSPVHIMWGESCSREDRLILNGITYSTRLLSSDSNE